MSNHRCPTCRYYAVLETRACGRCGAQLGFHWPSRSFLALDGDAAELDGERWSACANREWECNWLVGPHEYGARCFSCSLTRKSPERDNTIALEMVAEASVAKRRLLVQLLDLGLPITPYYEQEGGLAFDLLKHDRDTKVITGHANGVITIDVSETLDAQREALRIRLGEPYRTMLGHFRHEIGHYYQMVLVAAEPLLGEYRALFGDERASYAEALDRHYQQGAPDGWADSFISEYATMHPFEDFAETFAHYLHITGTLATASAAAVVLRADLADGLIDDDIVPRRSYSTATIGELLADWHWLSLVFNRVNQAMGKGDLYPFDISAPVVEKLGFVHRLVVTTGAPTGVAPP